MVSSQSAVPLLPPPNLGYPNLFPGEMDPKEHPCFACHSLSQGTHSLAGPLEAINKAGRSRRGVGVARGGGEGAESGMVPRTPWGQSQAVPLGSRLGLWSLQMGKGDMGGSSSPGD